MSNDHGKGKMSLTATTHLQVPIEEVEVSAFTIPTDMPESDGTLEWDRTVLVVVEIDAGGQTGLGYTYADGSIVPLIQGKLGSVISGHSGFAIAAANKALWRSIRNLGRSGLVATAISAVDAALLGSKGQASRDFSSRAARSLPRHRADLRQRRIHHLQR